MKHILNDPTRVMALLTIRRYNDKKFARTNRYEVDTQVYFSNKKLMRKAEVYAAKLAHRYAGPVFISETVNSLIVKLVDENGNAVGNNVSPN